MQANARRWAVAGAILGTGLTAAAAVTLGLLAGSGTAASAAAPQNTSPPTITGTPMVGDDLTAHTGSWTGNPTRYGFRWFRCNQNGGGCVQLGADAQVYTVKTGDVGDTLRVRVTATNADGSNSVTSAPTAVVTARPPATGCPPGNGPAAVSAINPPARLVIDRFTIDPLVVRRSTTSITARIHVSDTCGQSVTGALVYAAAVPFNQFTVGEQPTDANGDATLQMTKLSGFPAARRQQLLAIFVRARKPGENLLTGISNRRLVSVRVDLSS